mmetsp:Transcript_26713/g.59765  ORF Transcript_26713/g.59765 Transcript_26713/m.59765 type:complete len:202 (-) Transcript_26713:190-795(-)
MLEACRRKTQRWSERAEGELCSLTYGAAPRLDVFFKIVNCMVAGASLVFLSEELLTADGPIFVRNFVEVFLREVVARVAPRGGGVDPGRDHVFKVGHGVLLVLRVVDHHGLRRRERVRRGAVRAARHLGLLVAFAVRVVVVAVVHVDADGQGDGQAHARHEGDHARGEPVRGGGRRRGSEVVAPGDDRGLHADVGHSDAHV